MNKQRAEEILGDVVQKDGHLYNVGGYVFWRGGMITLDGEFTAEQLEAIAWWMVNVEVD